MFIQRHLLGLCIWASALGSASAHGLIESPPSRNWICGVETKPDHVTNGSAKHPECSEAFAVDQLAAYNFMSVVTHSLGRAKVTPLPKNVCGFDGEFWQGRATPWDAAMKWPTTPMTPGQQAITWNISWGNHYGDTEEFRYWITKPDFVFSPTKALTWEDFETEAFCVLKYDGNKPNANPNISLDNGKNRFITRCDIPPRNGHHVLYGEWGRTPPTIERFHGCIDVAFGAGTTIGIQGGPGSKRIQVNPPLQKATDVLGRARKAGSILLLPNK